MADSERTHPRWTVARARARFFQLLRDARREPQAIYRRGKLVAAVLDAEAFRQFTSWRERDRCRTLAVAFDELRRICEEEHYVIAVPERGDRDASFV